MIATDTAPGVALNDDELARIPDRRDGVEYRWHPIYDDYAVGSDGSVFSRVKRRRPLIHWMPHYYKLTPTAAKSRGGYLVISISNEDGTVQRRLNRFVLMTFVAPSSDKYHAAHRDGDRVNNAKSNLVWATAHDNIAHKHLHGTYRSDANHCLTQLPDSTRPQILKMRSEGMTWKRIGNHFGVSLHTAWSVGSGARYKNRIGSKALDLCEVLP